MEILLSRRVKASMMAKEAANLSGEKDVARCEFGGVLYPDENQLLAREYRKCALTTQRKFPNGIKCTVVMIATAN
jgi:hypothetical protein